MGSGSCFQRISYGAIVASTNKNQVLSNPTSSLYHIFYALITRLRDMISSKNPLNSYAISVITSFYPNACVILRSVVSSLLLLIFAMLISPSGRRLAYRIAVPSQRPISEFPRIDDPAQSFPNLLLGADLADLI